LSNAQKAALCFKAVCTGQADEAEKVFASVQRFNYRMSDAEFHKWADAFASLAALFGLMYWQQESRRAFASGAMVTIDMADLRNHEAGREIDEARGLETLELLQRIAGQQAALVAAMQELCNQHRLDWNAVLLFADIARECLPKEAPHPDWLERYRKELGELLPSL
jgi:hypothetical protein